jgi:heme-degrading monooxygenase HmoA
MAVIRSDQNVITQINVFEVDPKNQDVVVDLLKEAIRSVSGMPGWISASVHKSLDGKRVTNYAQAADYAAWEKIAESLRNAGFFERFQKLATPNPCLYHCTFSLSAD